MGQWNPHPDSSLDAPQPLSSGNHRVGPVWPERQHQRAVSWGEILRWTLFLLLNGHVVSPAEWAPWANWVWCPASWPRSRRICSLCAQLSVCSRNLVPQGLPSEFPDAPQSLFGTILGSCIWAVGRQVDLEHYSQLSRITRCYNALLLFHS